MSGTTYSGVNSTGLPRWYWIVAGAALLWMLFGVAAWFADFMMDESTLAQMPEAQRQVYEMRPEWMFALYAIAIGSGLLGAVALLLRKTWAVAMFAVSLVTAIVQFSYLFFGMNTIERLGPAVALPFPLLVIAIGIGLLWFSLVAKKQGWLR